MADPTTSLLTSNVIWSMGGLLVGLVVGALIARVTGTTRADRLRSLSGLVIIVLLAGSQITYYRTSSAQTALTECLRPYFVAVSAALASRTPDSDATALAQIDLLEATKAGDPGAAAAAIDTYVTRLRSQIENRRAQPIPPPPDCGGAP